MAQDSNAASHQHAFWQSAASIVRSRLADTKQISAEYRTVVKLDSHIDHTVFVSQRPENVPMNRYTNVLPYDYNMVTCGAGNASCTTASMSSSSTQYNNASTVRAEDRASGMEFKYICSQVGEGPQGRVVCIHEPVHVCACVCVCVRAFVNELS
jgi:protein tyrosine phosphatase